MSDPIEDLYQQLILDHYRRPRNQRQLDNPDHRAVGDNPLCGDHITIFVKLKDGLVEEVTFEGGGCAISTASASIMTETVKGKSLDEARRLFRKFHSMVTGGDQHATDLGGGLGKLEAFSNVCKYPVRVKCATLAWHTLNAALGNRQGVVTTE